MKAKKITGDDVARLLLEASTKCEATIQIWKETEKSRQFNYPEIYLKAIKPEEL